MVDEVKIYYTASDYKIKSQLVDEVEFWLITLLYWIFIIGDITGVVLGSYYGYKMLDICTTIFIIFLIEVGIIAVIWYLYPPSPGMKIYVMFHGDILSSQYYRYIDGGKIDADNILKIIELYKEKINNKIELDDKIQKENNIRQSRLEKHQNDLKYKHENVLYMVDSKLKNEELK